MDCMEVLDVTKSNEGTLAGKCLAIIFWDIGGIMLIDYMP